MSGAKKRWTSAVASALLVLLLLPCVHAAEHQHNDALDSVCAMAHAECRNCSSVPGSIRPEIRPADNSPAIESPVRYAFYIRTLDSVKPWVPSRVLSFSDVLPLLTFQLLI